MGVGDEMGINLTHNTSHLTPHTSHLTPHTSHLTPHTEHLTPHTEHLTRHTSYGTPHTEHLTRNTEHITRHTSRVTPCMPLIEKWQLDPALSPNPCRSPFYKLKERSPSHPLQGGRQCRAGTWCHLPCVSEGVSCVSCGITTRPPLNDKPLTANIPHVTTAAA